MKFLLQLILTAVGAYLLGQYLDWWAIVVYGLVLGLMFDYLSSWSSFFAGFLGVFLIWGILAYVQDKGNNSILSDQIAQAFSVSSGTYLVYMTGLIGGLLGGFASMTGTLFRKIFSGSRVQAQQVLPQ